MSNLEQARGGDHRAFAALLRAEDDGCRALADRLNERTVALHAVGPAGIAEARITLDRALAEVSAEHRALLVLVDGIGETVAYVDFDGTWAVVSRDDPIVDRSEPVTALAVNTGTGTVSSLPGTAGIVTLVVAG